MTFTMIYEIVTETPVLASRLQMNKLIDKLHKVCVATNPDPDQYHICIILL